MCSVSASISSFTNDRRSSDDERISEVSSDRPLNRVRMSWTSRLGRRSPLPRPFHALSLVATSGAGRAARIAVPESSVMASAVEIASSYHGLEDVGIGRHHVQDELRITASPTAHHGLVDRLVQATLP